MSGILLTLALSFCFLAFPASAKQKQGTPLKPLTADDIVAKMKFQLQLTDTQVQEVKPIIEDHLAREKQLQIQEKKNLARVLTGDQLYAWNFLQNEPPAEKKHSRF